jgi:GMP synthase-like glutamine amidotransferase
VKFLALVHGRRGRSGVFGETAQERGHEVEEWSLAWGEPPPRPLDEYGAVMVFGGAMHADQDDRHPWLREETLLLQRLLDSRTPVLGVCLGAQLLAEAAGEEPRRGRRPEIGWHPVERTAEGAADPLIRALPPAFTAFQWHSYEMGLDDGEVLARSDVCAQAARFGPRAWAIQFHAEVNERDALKWIADYESDPDAVAIGLDPEALAAETRERIGGWNEVGRAVCTRFLELAAAAS